MKWVMAWGIARPIIGSRLGQLGHRPALPNVDGQLDFGQVKTPRPFIQRVFLQNSIDASLWVRFNDGAWKDTGLPAQSGASGQFEYVFAYGHGTYEFARRPVDLAGNDEGVPTGPDATTEYRYGVFLPVALKP